MPPAPLNDSGLTSIVASHPLYSARAGVVSGNRRRKSPACRALPLQQLLARRRASQVREPVRLPTFCGEGLQPGIDLDDTAALVELMDERDASG